MQPLHEQSRQPFEDLLKSAPTLPRGWWELASLSPQDRVEFVRGFWQSVLPYAPHTDEAIGQFFGGLRDIGIVLVQESEESPHQPVMFFDQGPNRGFFCGRVPAAAEHLSHLREQFSDYNLPNDYLAFLKIHDGFHKAGDTGLIPSGRLTAAYQEFGGLLSERDPLLLHFRESDHQIDPSDLIPFYQSFGLDSFQCFYADWYPQQEMGNVYYSGIDHSLSDYMDQANLHNHLAFPTFLDWLVFYLD